MTYSVLLLGLGQIGMGYDYDAADNTLVLTHARAFFEHPAFVLSGGIDIDAEKRERFTMRYAAPSFADLDSALATVQPNVVVVATPTATHRNAVDSILKTFRPQAILCEKPLSARLEEAKAIMDALCSC